MTVKRTRGCYSIARPSKPGVKSSNTSRVRSRFYHIHFVYKRNCDGSCLMSITQKVTRNYISFEFAICPIALLSLGETFHLKGRDVVTVWQTVLFRSCYDCDSIMTSGGLNTFCDVAQCMNRLWIFITKLESPKGDS